MATVEEVQAKLTALINNLSPQARRQLASNIGQALRKNQQARIARQENPDGTAFEPRKPRKEFGKKKGRIKRKAMFAKLRTARHLKVWSMVTKFQWVLMAQVLPLLQCINTV